MANEQKRSFLGEIRPEEDFLSAPFRSAVAEAEVEIAGIAQVGSPCYQLLGYDDKGTEVLLFEKKMSVKEGGGFSYLHSFDPISFAVYQNAQSLRIRLTGIEKAELTKLTLTEVEQSAQAEFSRVLRKHRGPKSLKNVLFVGNSLLLGIENRYGMCCSAPDKDYFYHVSQEIKKSNPDCQFFKLHGSGIEHAESIEEFEEVYNERPNIYTKRPVKESFTPDLDLIILQITDNVNTDKKVETFHTTAKLLLERIRKNCPHAEILWVYGWYYKRSVMEYVLDFCKQYDVEPVDLRPVRYRANESSRGSSMTP